MPPIPKLRSLKLILLLFAGIVAPAYGGTLGAPTNGRIVLVPILWTTQGSGRTAVVALGTQPAVQSGDACSPDDVVTNTGGMIASSAVVRVESCVDIDSAGEDRQSKINRLDVTQVIDLYDYDQGGATRNGPYHIQAGTEDWSGLRS